MRLNKSDVSWIIDRAVTGRVREDESVFVTDGNRQMSLALRFSDGLLSFNGQLVDVGEDLFEYLAVMDEIAQTGKSEPLTEA